MSKALKQIIKEELRKLLLEKEVQPNFERFAALQAQARDQEERERTREEDREYARASTTPTSLQQVAQLTPTGSPGFPAPGEIVSTQPRQHGEYYASGIGRVVPITSPAPSQDTVSSAHVPRPRSEQPAWMRRLSPGRRPLNWVDRVGTGLDRFGRDYEEYMGDPQAEFVKPFTDATSAAAGWAWKNTVPQHTKNTLKKLGDWYANTAVGRGYGQDVKEDHDFYYEDAPETIRQKYAQMTTSGDYKQGLQIEKAMVALEVLGALEGAAILTSRAPGGYAAAFKHAVGRENRDLAKNLDKPLKMISRAEEIGEKTGKTAGQVLSDYIADPGNPDYDGLRHLDPRLGPGGTATGHVPSTERTLGKIGTETRRRRDMPGKHTQRKMAMSPEEILAFNKREGNWIKGTRDPKPPTKVQMKAWKTYQKSPRFDLDMRQRTAMKKSGADKLIDEPTKGINPTRMDDVTDATELAKPKEGLQGHLVSPFYDKVFDKLQSFQATAFPQRGADESLGSILNRAGTHQIVRVQRGGGLPDIVIDRIIRPNKKGVMEIVHQGWYSPNAYRFNIQPGKTLSSGLGKTSQPGIPFDDLPTLQPDGKTIVYPSSRTARRLQENMRWRRKRVRINIKR